MPEDTVQQLQPCLPACLPAGTDKCTEVLQISSSFTIIGFTDLIYYLFVFFSCHQIRKTGSELGIQTNRRTDIWTESSGHCGVNVATGLLLSLVTRLNKDNSQSTILSSEVVGGCSVQQTAIGESSDCIEAERIHC